jgi:hypothetical protein
MEDDLVDLEGEGVTGDWVIVSVVIGEVEDPWTDSNRAGWIFEK